MAVFRVERNKGYTVMSNHHLRNKELSLKAKGLLSQMLSLPEDWDYTLKGLSLINREKIDAIREAIRELERAGYIVRSRERDENGYAPYQCASSQHIHAAPLSPRRQAVFRFHGLSHSLPLPAQRTVSSERLNCCPYPVLARGYSRTQYLPFHRSSRKRI